MKNCWYIGEALARRLSQGTLRYVVRPEDEQAAEAAGIPFLTADIWHQRFSPGFQELRGVTPAQLEFLEGNRSGD